MQAFAVDRRVEAVDAENGDTGGDGQWIPGVTVDMN